MRRGEAGGERGKEKEHTVVFQMSTLLWVPAKVALDTQDHSGKR